MSTKENKQKVAIFGSRKIDVGFSYSMLSDMMNNDCEYITSGNIEGVAKVAYQVAKDKGLQITLHCYNTKLGLYQALQDIMTKNKKMVDTCDSAIVIWDGESKGTKREIKMLDKQNKPYELMIHNKNKLIEIDKLKL